MNLIDQLAVHRIFGVGSVRSIEDGRIEVQFSERTGIKFFPYPDAFRSFLKMCDPNVQELVDADLTTQDDDRIDSMNQKMQLYRDIAEQQQAEQAAQRKAARARKAKKV